MATVSCRFGQPVDVGALPGTINLTLRSLHHPVEQEVDLFVGAHGQRPGVFAIRFELENLASNLVDPGMIAIHVRMSSERWAAVDTLAEIDELLPGERVEGWFVSFARDGETPLFFDYFGAMGTHFVWALDDVQIEQTNSSS